VTNSTNSMQVRSLTSSPLPCKFHACPRSLERVSGAAAGSAPGISPRPPRAIVNSKTPAPTVAATIIQLAVCTPVCLLTKPKARAVGRNAIQDSAPTPEATPERIADGTASWRRRVT
jgi:hypothetical protein